MVLWEASRLFLLSRKLLLLHLHGKLHLHHPTTRAELCRWPRCAELQNFTSLRWATSWLSHYPLLPGLPSSSAASQLQSRGFLETPIVYAAGREIPFFVKPMAPCPANKSLSCLYAACLTHLTLDWIIPAKISLLIWLCVNCYIYFWGSCSVHLKRNLKFTSGIRW